MTAEDWEGNVESQTVRGDNYVVVTMGRLNVVHEQKFQNGTVVITLKRDRSEGSTSADEDLAAPEPGEHVKTDYPASAALHRLKQLAAEPEERL